MAVDSAGNVYLADTGNDRIQKFDSSGTFIGWLGKCTAGANCDTINQKSNGFACTTATCTGLGDGSGDGQVSNPGGLHVDGSDNLYVANTGLGNVQVFDSTGTFLLKLGSFGSGDGQLFNNFDVAVDGSGNIYVADVSNERVDKFDSSGAFLGWAGKCTAGSNCDIPNLKSNGFACTAATCTGATSGNGDGQFATPRGVAVDSSGNVYVADTDDTFLPVRIPELEHVAAEIEDRRIRMGKDSGFEKNYAKVTMQYFGGMARHLEGLKSLLKPGAKLAYVVGDQASYLRVLIRTGHLLSEIANSLGYESERIDLFRTRRATATRSELREEVLVLRWPG
ncbi:MAG: hypothetical protein IH867_13600 [Chloroflexi bacterium]|nr:hypothetical protein [Chloroflexota bacterium]